MHSVWPRWKRSMPGYPKSQIQIGTHQSRREWPEDPPLPVKVPKPKKRKPARRIVVTEVSSESEDEEDVEVVLPKYKQPPAPSKEELHMQRAMDKMFSYGI